MSNNYKELTISQKASLFFCAVLSIPAILIVVFFVEKSPKNKVLIAVLSAICYIAVCGLVIWAFGLVGKKVKVKAPSSTMLGTIMYDVVNSSNEPAIICNEDGRIVWCNKYTYNLSDAATSLVGTKLSALLPDGIQENTDEGGNKTLLTIFKKSIYTIDRSKIQSSDKTYYLLMFRDITKYENLKKYVSDEEIIVAYIVVDNLEELLQFEQEKYREAAAKIELLIREWAQSVHGIVKEYEKDKYIFIFKSKNLDKFIQDKFDILDKVRQIRVGAGNISVTLSIGVAKISAEYSDKDSDEKLKDEDTIELEDKEKTAHIALDLALQRGGDQVVLKRANQEPEFFGGRTNAVQKRTKVRARVVSNQLVPMIKKAGNVIVMAHKYPDYDAFGASCGMARLAMFCGTKVNVITNFKDTNIKKCMKLFANDDSYKGIFVDSAAALDLIRSDTLLIIVDVNNTAMFESSDVAKNVSDIVIIDHHRKTAEFEKNPLITYIETSASSASELVTEMLEQCLPPATLKNVEANMLLAGILLDTKQFTKGTGPKTYASAMYLKDNGGAYEQIQDLFKTNIKDYRQEAMFGQQLDIYRHCTAIAVNYNGQDSNDRILAARVADNLLMVEEVAASFALVQIDDVIHISARSNGTINVQLILEALDGGGRYDAAGAQVKSDSMQDTLMKLKKAIDDYLDPED